jgi:hypothetical protein
LKIHIHCGGLFAHVVVFSGDASSLVVGGKADEADGTNPWLAQADSVSAPIAAAALTRIIDKRIGIFLLPHSNEQ